SAACSAPTPLILVHGLAASGRYMLPTARRLANDFPVLVPDLPGYGRSEKPRRALDVDALAQRLLAWMSARGVLRASLLGNSFGCQVAAAIAEREPARIERLVLNGPTVDSGRRTTFQQLLSFVADVPREPLGLVLTQLRAYARTGPWFSLQGYRHMMADRIERRLPRIRAPTLLVRGERDPVAPQRWVDEIASLLPRGCVAVIPGSAHGTVYNAAQPLARLVRDFLLEQA
ncbi:MAG TPA: alpha/beta hydrolase, partial [Burkholderiaceae bacterium]|nr:alpha/beta hydrolase [Burkholderiaceae bacterium]